MIPKSAHISLLILLASEKHAYAVPTAVVLNFKLSTKECLAQCKFSSITHVYLVLNSLVIVRTIHVFM